MGIPSSLCHGNNDSSFSDDRIAKRTREYKASMKHMARLNKARNGREINKMRAKVQQMKEAREEAAVIDHEKRKLQEMITYMTNNQPISRPKKRAKVTNLYLFLKSPY